MTKNPTAEAPPGSPANPIDLPKDKSLLKTYYRGRRLESPLGGLLDVLGVREGSDGTGRVLMECNTSSLRFTLIVPKATRTERSKVKAILDAGGDPHCPRHGSLERLTRTGKDWVCPLCGVSYAKATK
jgi:hypothetical protein